MGRISTRIIVNVSPDFFIIHHNLTRVRSQLYRVSDDISCLVYMSGYGVASHGPGPGVEAPAEHANRRLHYTLCNQLIPRAYDFFLF